MHRDKNPEPLSPPIRVLLHQTSQRVLTFSNIILALSAPSSSAIHRPPSEEVQFTESAPPAAPLVVPQESCGRKQAARPTSIHKRQPTYSGHEIA